MPRDTAVIAFRQPEAIDDLDTAIVSRRLSFVGLNELGGNLINREVNGDYGGLPTHEEIGFIG